MKFRAWLREKWYEHLDELESIGAHKPEYDLGQYFRKYKYWLKREYRHQFKD
jgi:hypothetical protein